MSKEYTLADFTDIFDYSTGWFSDSSICSLFYQIFKRFPSMKMVKYKVNQDFLKEIKKLYQQDDAFDIFEHIYCNHFENEKEEEEEEEDTSTKELYDCIVICKKNLMIGYFDNCTKIAYSNIDKEEIDRINQICENHKKENEKLNNLFIVTYSHNYFSLKQSQINKPGIQIDRHYNNDFAPVAAEIENFLLEENKSGLIILHGKQGTGKTTYIRHLINLGKKRMIYMSGDLVDKLSDPSFITFIRQQKNNKAKHKENKQQKPHHYISTDGFDIYIGKNNLQNDWLTLKFANASDIWFHTKKIHGSHAIIKLGVNKDIPHATMIEAAELCAYYSKARESNQVPVDYTIIKNVKKPNGAKPGMVIYDGYNTVYVTPKAHDELRIDNA